MHVLHGIFFVFLNLCNFLTWYDPFLALGNDDDDNPFFFVAVQAWGLVKIKMIVLQCKVVLMDSRSANYSLIWPRTQDHTLNKATLFSMM